MENPIKLHCRCGRTTDYERSVDRNIPASVVRIESDNCDQCENGDFGGERWFDAAGNEVAQTAEDPKPPEERKTDEEFEEAFIGGIDFRELEEARADLFIGRREDGLIHLERALGGDFVGRIAQR